MSEYFENENQQKPKNAGFMPFVLILVGFTILLVLGKYLFDFLSK